MIERYIEITCDVCGEIEWSPSNVPLVEFKRDFISTWKHRKDLSMCPGCITRGKRWADATLHSSQSTESDRDLVE